MFESLTYEELIESKGVTSNLEPGNGDLIIWIKKHVLHKFES